MTETALLEVNGEIMKFPAAAVPATITQLLSILKIDSRMIIAELNGDIVKRQNFDVQCLASGDKVELVRFVGGG